MISMTRYGLSLMGHPLFALGFGEFLNGVAQGGARHRVGSGLEPLTQRIRIFLAGFTEQPAYGFLNQIMFVMKQDIGYGVGISCLTMADKLHGYRRQPKRIHN